MKRATGKRVLTQLKKFGSLSYADLVEQFTTPQKLDDVLRNLENSEVIVCDREGKYSLSRKEQSRESQVTINEGPHTGVLMNEEKHWYVRSLVPGQSADVQVPAPRDKKITSGDIVSFEITKFNKEDYHGQVLAKIPTKDEASRAALAYLIAYEVPHESVWDPDRATFADSIDTKSIRGRVDLRKRPFVTIDGETAKDFDDAVFVEPLPENGWRMLVAIADVAHYVRPNDGLDREARRRGNSIYLPDRVIPMLPEDLSNGVCSLKPNIDRLVVVCDMRITEKGKVDKFDFYEAVIRSAGRLTYTEAVAVCHGKKLPGGSRAINASLIQFYEVFRTLRKVREHRGALDFTSRESSVRIVDGEPVEVVVHHQNEAHQMIEEAMISANVCAAQYLEKHNLKPLYRVHGKPDVDALKTLQSTLKQRHVVNFDFQDRSSKEMQHLLDSIRRSTKDSWVWELQVLRAMLQARYSFVQDEHFGLALEEYSHFTSPIRRYADLYLHRLIKSTFKSSKQEVNLDPEITYLGEDLSDCERRATSVSRKVDSWLKCRLLQKMKGKTFEGVISGIEEFGIFVELDHYHVSGLIHVTDLGEDYWVPGGTVMQGSRTGIEYCLGDRMRVVIVSVDVEYGRIELIEFKPRRKKRVNRVGKVLLHRSEQ